MDTTETYIKMSEKAEEIQKDHILVLWDTVYPKIQLIPNRHYCPVVTSFNIDRVWLNIGCDMIEEVARDLLIWLPRQDQLQEMRGKLPVGSMRRLSSDIFRGETYLNHCLSMEQLWLAFVMKEKYNKVWDGENWEVICYQA